MADNSNMPGGRLENPSTNCLQPIYFSQQDAFTCLYDAYVDRIYRYIYFRVVDDQLSESITSQVFLQVWEKLPMYETGKSPIISWLYSIAYNIIIAQSSSQETSAHLNTNNQAVLTRKNGIDEDSSLQIKSKQLPETFSELADKQQQVLILQWLCGLSTARIVHQYDKQQGIIRVLQMGSIMDTAHSTIAIQEIYGQ